MWLTAGGDEGKVEFAINTLRNAALGLLALALSYLLIAAILSIAEGSLKYQ